MSLNISEDIVICASKIEVTIDTDKFGPRQITAFHTAVQTGVMKGRGVPVRVARAIRRKLNAPWVSINTRSVTWGNVPSDADTFYNTMTAALVALRMDSSSGAESKYNTQSMDTAFKSVEDRLPSGGLYVYSTAMAKMVIKNFKFTIDLPNMERFVVIDFWDGKEVFSI